MNLRYLLCISDSILDLYNRLFNHRPFLKGEVTHFVKEFETKRGDQEVQNLFETLEVTTELQSGQVEKLVTTCDDQLPTVNANLLVAQSMCNKILDQAQLNLKKGHTKNSQNLVQFKTFLSRFKASDLDEYNASGITLLQKASDYKILLLIVRS